MKKSQIAAQLYSFREYIKTPSEFVETLVKLKRIGYDSVQLSGSIAPMPKKELRRILDEEGMSAPTSHEAGGRIINETEKVIDELLELGCPHCAYPYPHMLPKNAGECLVLAGQLETAAVRMAASGIKLAYHNHDIEFIRFGKETMLELIYRHAPALEAEIDTFWIQSGGGNPVSWITRMNGRMEVLHIKDYGIENNRKVMMMPIGEGVLSWREIISAAELAGVKCFVVEHDGDCSDPFASVRCSLDYLSGHFIK